MNEDIKKIVLQTNSWRDAKTKIKQAGFDFGIEELLRIMIFWQQNIASKMTDDELISELVFWSEDGSFEKHLKGFDAIPPQILAYEAERRNWNVIKAVSGSIMVKPPLKAAIIVKETL